MTKRDERIQNMTPEMKEVVAENMKERVYSTITPHSGADSHVAKRREPQRGVRLRLFWVALLPCGLQTLISIRMSYRAIPAWQSDQYEWLWRALFRHRDC